MCTEQGTIIAKIRHTTWKKARIAREYRQYIIIALSEDYHMPILQTHDEPTESDVLY